MIRPKTVVTFPRVKSFLDAISKKSLKTMTTYSAALMHFGNFIKHEYPDLDSDSIIDAIIEGKLDVYKLLDNFVSYIQSVRQGITTKTITAYMFGIRSYFAYHDVDIIPSKYRRKVFLPKSYREDEEPIDGSDFRKLLLSCSNRRLKSYLLVLGSGGMRTIEALAIRNCDISFDINPTRIHLRKEYSKTGVGRDIYISDEATYYLKQFLERKYNNPDTPRERKEDDLVFTIYKNAKSPQVLYQKICMEFQKLLASVNMDQRKDTGILKRRKITLHSIRRMVKTIIATQTNSDYSEFYLGHSKSPYWTMKEEQRREIYKLQCMPFLTYLDYTALENSSKGIISKLDQKDKEVAYLRDRDLKRESEMNEMRQTMDKILAIVQENPKLAKVKKEVLSKI